MIEIGTLGGRRAQPGSRTDAIRRHARGALIDRGRDDVEQLEASRRGVLVISEERSARRGGVLRE